MALNKFTGMGIESNDYAHIPTYSYLKFSPRPCKKSKLWTWCDNKQFAHVYKPNDAIVGVYILELGRLPTPKPKTEVFLTTEVGIATTEKTENREKITEISV